jgi:hypothetical protein
MVDWVCVQKIEFTAWCSLDGYVLYTCIEVDNLLRITNCQTLTQIATNLKVPTKYRELTLV